MSDMRDKLLREDGIDPTDVSEQELARFRTLLAQERKRARRLVWLIQILLWVGVLLLLGVCAGEDLWDLLHIPFLAAFALAVITMQVAVRVFAKRIGRRLEETQSRIRRLESRLPEHAGARPRGLPLLARKGEQPLIFWPGVLLLVMLLSLLAVAWVTALRLILPGKPWGFVTIMLVAMEMLFVAGLLRIGLTRPLDELRELGQPNPRLWVSAPRVLTLRIWRTLWIIVQICLPVFVGVVVVASFFWGGAVYPKVARNLYEASRFHMISREFEDGRPVTQSEIWHLRDIGTRKRWQRGERPVEFYDDGREGYTYIPGDEYAVKWESQDLSLPYELLDPLLCLLDARREAARDRTVEGQLWRGYRRQDSNRLVVIWIDGTTRLRRYEECRRVGGRWQQEKLIEIDYEPFELEMPPEVFERQGIRIIDSTEARQVSL